jgi:hypothetical protein
MSAATRQEISEWFDLGRNANTRPKYMLVICDTYDHDDYPSYFTTRESALDKIANPGNMQRVMEVYDLTLNKDEQLDLFRAWSIR